MCPVPGVPRGQILVKVGRVVGEYLFSLGTLPYRTGEYPYLRSLGSLRLSTACMNAYQLIQSGPNPAFSRTQRCSSPPPPKKKKKKVLKAEKKVYYSSFAINAENSGQIFKTGTNNISIFLFYN